MGLLFEHVKTLKNIMVTVSGGRSSAMMARHIQTSEQYKDFEKVYVFANTGMERPETIQFLKDIETFWKIPLIKVEGVYSEIMGVGIGYNIVEWDDLNMNGKPYEQCVIHKNKGIFDGLPNQEAPYCSDSLKTIPCKKLCDSMFGVNNYIKAIGFRAEDMPKRISFAEINADKKRIFPLLTDFSPIIGKRLLAEFWAKQPFKLQIDSSLGNCELCWKKGDKSLVESIKAGSRFIDWHIQNEEKYGNTSFRGNRSIKDLMKLAQTNATIEMDFNHEDGCVCSF